MDNNSNRTVKVVPFTQEATQRNVIQTNEVAVTHGNNGNTGMLVERQSAMSDFLHFVICHQGTQNLVHNDDCACEDCSGTNQGVAGSSHVNDNTYVLFDSFEFFKAHNCYNKNASLCGWLSHVPKNEMFMQRSVASISNAEYKVWKVKFQSSSFEILRALAPKLHFYDAEGMPLRTIKIDLFQADSQNKQHEYIYELPLEFMINPLVALTVDVPTGAKIDVGFFIEGAMKLY